MSTGLEELRDEILGSPQMPQGSLYEGGPSMRSIAAIGLVDLGVLTQAAGLILESTGDLDLDDREHTEAELAKIVVPAASHVGSLKDHESNKLMTVIGGPLFLDTFKVLRGLSSSHTYPRYSTAEDASKAKLIDEAIADYAARFLTSPDGAFLTKPADVNDTVGCPLRHAAYPSSDTTYFDKLATATVAEYADPESPYFRLGYYGIATSIVERIKPPYEGAVNGGGWFDDATTWENRWELPNPATYVTD